MGKVPHRKRLTRRKDRDLRKSKKPPDKCPIKAEQYNVASSGVQVPKQISPHFEGVTKLQLSSCPSVCDPMPLTPLVEKLKQYFRRLRYENSSRTVKSNIVSVL